MTDKPELSWYPTTIDELQRLLDSGVWPRVRAIADDVGPLQIAQGRLTYIDTPKLGGMSGILREGPAPAGAEPFDLTSRSLWLWRAESSASSTPSGSALAVERLRAFDEALDKLERRAGHVSWQAFAAALQRWGTAASPMARSDVASALGSLADSWADELPKPEMLAERKNPRDADADAEVERLADYLLRNHASACTGPGEGVSAVDVAIGLLAQAGEERRRLLEAQKADRAMCDDALRRIADASRLTVLGQRAPEYAMELAERVEKQFADFRKVADRLSIDREIAGAAEQLVRRLVDRLVETDPEYIEQLRRSGS